MDIEHCWIAYFIHYATGEGMHFIVAIANSTERATQLFEERANEFFRGHSTTAPLGEILEQPFVASLLPPLLERHRKSIDIMRERAECRQGTIFFDVTGFDLEGYNKFVPYYLFPDSIYSVGLSKSSFRTKVSVGSNPWTKANPDGMVNLAKICERYGGGGHARVGAISFEPDKLEEARSAARDIVAELRSSVVAPESAGQPHS